VYGINQPPAPSLQDQLAQLSAALGAQQATVAAQQANASPVNRNDLVSGIEGARQFLQNMLPGTSHIVWDKDQAVFFGLQKDANGNPARISINRFTTELEPTPEERMEKQMEDKYVTKDDFAKYTEALTAKFEALLTQRAEVKNG